MVDKPIIRWKRDYLDDYLRAYVKRNGATITAFCRDNELNRANLYNLIRGRIKRPSGESLSRLSVALGLPPERLPQWYFSNKKEAL